MSKITITFEIGELPPGVTGADVQAAVESMLLDRNEGRYPFDVEHIETAGCSLVRQAVEAAVKDNCTKKYAGPPDRDIAFRLGYSARMAEILCLKYPAHPRLFRPYDEDGYDEQVSEMPSQEFIQELKVVFLSDEDYKPLTSWEHETQEETKARRLRWAEAYAREVSVGDYSTAVGIERLLAAMRAEAEHHDESDAWVTAKKQRDDDEMEGE